MKFFDYSVSMITKFLSQEGSSYSDFTVGFLLDH